MLRPEPQPTRISAIAHYTESRCSAFDAGMSGVFRSTSRLNEPIRITRMKEQYVPAGYTGGALTKAE